MSFLKMFKNKGLVAALNVFCEFNDLWSSST